MTSQNDWPSSAWLASRGLLWTVLLPGVVAGYVPWKYLGLNRVQSNAWSASGALGVAFIVTGVVLLTVCIVEFARTGRGTLSPLDPPRQLVARGIYRYVRNPMYVSVSAIVLGEWLLVRSAAMGVYWLTWLVCANLFVIAYEEPALHRRFGASYDEYRRQVGRWIPKRGAPRP